MPRYKLQIEYDGTAYVGWQRQTNGLSIQQAIETAIEAVDGASVTLRGAGRTDAGVHATGQVGHVDLVKLWRTDRLRDAINAHLRGQRIAIVAAWQVPPEFDARFSAVRRHYLYRIINRRAPLALGHGQAWLVKRALDAPAMHAAAQLMLGRHDFSTFRDSECQAESAWRTLEQMDVVRTGEMVEVRVAARSFLHRQVRSMVGSLEHVGSGKWQAADLSAALKARDRARCGQVAPADGLFLVRVDYAECSGSAD